MSNPQEQSPDAGITRRSFLEVAGAAAAGLAIGSSGCTQPGVTTDGPATGPVILGEAAKDPSKTINCALIGAGRQGRSVLMYQVVRSLPDVRFKAVCDIWPYSLSYATKMLAARKQEATGYADYQEMLAKEKDLDAAIVATPDWMHAEHAIACMKAGLHVYCEKEMSNDIAKARAMVLASRETKKLLQIGHQRRSNPRYLFAHDKLLGEAKILGQITEAYGQWARSVTASKPFGAAKSIEPDADMLKKYGYESVMQFLNWRWFKKYGGGVIEDLGSHQIDIFGWFLGVLPRSVTAVGGRDYFKEYECNDNVMCAYEFPTPSGVVRALYQVLSTTSARGYFESFMGTDGSLNISEDPALCKLRVEGSLAPGEGDEHPWQKWVKKGYIVAAEESPPVPVSVSGGKAEQQLTNIYRERSGSNLFLFNIDFDENYFTAHLQNFFAAVRGQAKLNCPGEVGYETAVQVLRINEAVAARKTLEFKPEDFKV